MKSLCAFLALLVITGCATVRGETAAVTPQRPTVSSDTNTTHRGTVELETGVVVDHDQSFDVPTTLKYGAGAATEIFGSWLPYRWLEAPGDDTSGVSDPALGLRHRFWDETDAAPSAAMQLAVKIPLADEGAGLSTGEPDAFAAAIASKAFGPFGATAYYQFGVLGQSAGGVDIEHTGALAGSLALTDSIAAFTEAAAIAVPDQGIESYFSTSGLALAVSRSWVLDVGVLAGWNHDAPDLAFIVGWTANFGPGPHR
ncbi:MAG: hypothetical protein AAF628_24820 [Planctomycetota bacterium]